MEIAFFSIITPMMDNLLMALFITLFCEIFVILCYKHVNLKLLIIAFFTNIVTNISMNIILMNIKYQYMNQAIIIAEISVFILEALIYFMVTKKLKHALLLSLIANALSYSIGFIVSLYI